MPKHIFRRGQTDFLDLENPGWTDEHVDRVRWLVERGKSPENVVAVLEGMGLKGELARFLYVLVSCEWIARPVAPEARIRCTGQECRRRDSCRIGQERCRERR